MIIFPDHGSQEVGKGLKKKILKNAGIQSHNSEKKYEKN